MKSIYYQEADAETAALEKKAADERAAVQAKYPALLKEKQDAFEKAKAAAAAEAKKNTGAEAGADMAKTTSGSVENSLAFGAVVVAALAVVRERDV